jgi:galactonate dehydratase
MRLSRRDVLLAAGTVVAPFLALKSAQAAVPRLRVRGVDLLPVRATNRTVWLIVRLQTDAGLVGLGEASDAFGFANTTADDTARMRSQLKAFFDLVNGRSPFEIERYRQQGEPLARQGLVAATAFSAIEQALWDLAGKRLGVPVVTLLGGPCRERIRVYANGWYSGAKSPDAYAAKAKDTVARGFTALKFDPFPGPWRTHISREAERQVVETVRAVREAVGPKIDLLIECHRRLAPMHAVRVAAALEPFEPFWYEEPVSARDLGALAECRREIRLPIVTGEELYTRFEFREVFERRAADIINPDVCNVGGIEELKAIAAMAEAYHVVVSPHNYNSVTVGLAATLHVSAAIPNFLITEYFVNFEPRAREVVVAPFKVEDGYVAVPTVPGLGIELREDVLARYAYREHAPRTMPTPGDEGP